MRNRSAESNFMASFERPYIQTEDFTTQGKNGCYNQGADIACGPGNKYRFAIHTIGVISGFYGSTLFA
jgi:hypothetical protein